MPVYGWIIIGVVVILIIYFIATRNGLVVAKNKVEEELSQIDVSLKKRFDLIPNLVETVKGYAKHEKETIEEAINLRNKYLNASATAEKLETDSKLEGTLNKIFALAENYPDLKANKNFLELQDQLSKIEEDIARARQTYNAAVVNLNNRIEVFPSNIVASMCHYTKAEFFKATEEEKKNPEIKF